MPAAPKKQIKKMSNKSKKPKTTDTPKVVEAPKVASLSNKAILKV